MISIKEKEKLVIRVPNKGKAIREIGKIVHVSLGSERS
jgi:transposase